MLDTTIQIKTKNFDGPLALLLLLIQKEEMEINNLDLKINRQEVLGMLGPNGVGKSTIFHIVTGLKNPTMLKNK